MGPCSRNGQGYRTVRGAGASSPARRRVGPVGPTPGR
jgi:hypothetical protein